MLEASPLAKSYFWIFIETLFFLSRCENRVRYPHSQKIGHAPEKPLPADIIHRIAQT
jgi:hypothetical protein